MCILIFLSKIWTKSVHYTWQNMVIDAILTYWAKVVKEVLAESYWLQSYKILIVVGENDLTGKYG